MNIGVLHRTVIAVAAVPFGYSLAWHICLPLLPPSTVSVAKTKDRQSQAPRRHKIAPQAPWLARHSRTNAIKAQMDAPRTYQRICNEIQALEAKAKQTRFRKQIDIRTFGYHVD